MDARARRTLLSIWFFLGLLPLFLRPLWEPDEGRYAEIPREMLASGDWLTPHLNYLLYFEKPPLQYWLSAASMQLFGLHAWAARLPLALASGLILWAAWRIARRLGARDPRWAAFMAATALLSFVVGQILTLDALFSAFLVAGTACFLEAVAARFEGTPATGWTLATFALLAFALLTKGVAEVVLSGGIVVFSLPFAWKDRRLRSALLRTTFDPWGWLLYALIAVPWFVLVNRVNPGHAWFFFIYEHFTRFLTHEHARQGANNWFLDKLYFVAILGVGLLPWLSAAVIGLRRGLGFLRTTAKGPQSEGAPLHRWTIVMVVLAFAWPLVFFSLSGSKLPPYILPAIVPLVALAVAFEREGEEVRAFQRIGIELLLLGLVLGAAGLLAQKQLGAGSQWALLPGPAFVLLGLWCLRPRGLSASGWMLALGAVLWIFAYGVHRAAGPDKDAGTLVRRAPQEARWISFGVYYQVLPFETRERCVVVAGTGELGFGRDKLTAEQRRLWIPDQRDLLLPTAQRLRDEAPARPVRILMKDRDWKELDPQTRSALVQLDSRGNNVVAGLR
jgi:4-amino-4-deoxy-L-arabinose transferase-like glycosyltransferase